jgi:hypothetical protein
MRSGMHLMQQVSIARSLVRAHRGIGRRDMALTAAHCLLRASEAKAAARMSPDKKLSELFLQIAQSYEALADDEQWLEGKRYATAARV